MCARTGTHARAADFIVKGAARLFRVCVFILLAMFTGLIGYTGLYAQPRVASSPLWLRPELLLTPGARRA